MVTTRKSYLEKVSQMISWGHWFALFNILIALGLGSRYLFIADWPATLPGRLYAIVSWLGHFSFVGFALYLLIIFPLTFIVMSQRLLRVMCAALATTVLTLLLIDIEIFSLFHLHLNPVVWEMLINPDQSELYRDWQLIFISVPVIFLIEILFGTWSWQKLRSLSRKKFARPLVGLFFIAFVASHLTYIWADANFYRQITMQRSNYPLSYPMTARRFLEKHGLLDAKKYQERINHTGIPDALSVEYPLNKLSYQGQGAELNLLLVVVDGLRVDSVHQDLPIFSNFAQQNINFTRHYSSGNDSDTGLFGLFYGISPTYMDGILAGRKPAALISALIERNYQFGLFSSNGFSAPLYRRALLTDFTLPAPENHQDSNTVKQWQHWLNTQTSTTPWFSYINLNDTRKALTGIQDSKNPQQYVERYHHAAREVDSQIGDILNTLAERHELEKTVIVITASHGVEFNDNGHNDWGFGSDYSRYQLQVPLAIHWPGTSAQAINKMTTHADVMATLMQRLLYVDSRPSSYTQGEDLFTPARKNNWLALGDNKNLVIITPEQTALLNSSDGRYRTYDPNTYQRKDEHLQLNLLLPVLTDLKRFLAD